MSAADDDASDHSYRTLYAEAVALRRTARWEDAAQRLDAVLASLDESPEDDAEVSLFALYLKIDCLPHQGDGERTLAACDALLARYGASTDPKPVDVVVDTRWMKSRALSGRGELEQERSLLRYLIDEYGEESRPQVARAMFNEGIYLRDEGRGDEAVEMWDDLFSRFSAHPPKSDPFIPIRGQLAKSQYLAETNRLDAALLTCDRMLIECARLDLPAARSAEVRRTAHQCMGTARRSRRLSRRLRSLHPASVYLQRRSLDVPSCDAGLASARRSPVDGSANVVRTRPGPVSIAAETARLSAGRFGLAAAVGWGRRGCSVRRGDGVGSGG